MLYLDSSALVKLVASEPESAALFEFLAGRTELVSSAIARVEVTRAVRRRGDDRDLQERAEAVLGSLALLHVDDAVLTAAATLGPGSLRTLDAIHLASALSVREELEGALVYDRDLAEGAREEGLTVLAPASGR